MTRKQNILLDDGLVLDAASGAAPDAIRVLAACQAELNDDAGQRLGGAEAAFGVLLEDCSGAAISAELLPQTLARLDEETCPATPRHRDGADRTYPIALERILSPHEPIVWKPRFGGMSEHVIDRLCEPGVHVRLLKLPAGWRAPEHAHGGDELTLVLSGAFKDEAGVYYAGELCHAGSGHLHRPAVAGDEECVCLVVEFGALRPTNPLLSVASALFGRLF